MPDQLHLEDHIPDVQRTIPLSSNRGKLVITDANLVLIRTKPEYEMKTIKKEDVSLGHIHNLSEPHKSEDVENNNNDAEMMIFISNKSISMEFDMCSEDLSRIWVSEMVEC
jgi:hypothetical protein